MHVVTSATVGLAKVQKLGDTTVFQRLLSDMHISFGPYTASLPHSPPPVAPRRMLRHAYIMGQSCWLPTKSLPVSANHISACFNSAPLLAGHLFLKIDKLMESFKFSHFCICIVMTHSDLC